MRTLIIIQLILICSFSAAAQIGNNIFGQDQVIDISLQFADPNFWPTLLANYETGDYAAATITITDFSGTTVIPSIGVRIKGLSSFDHPGNKKALKLDFNEFISGQNYNGLKKLNLHNSFNDPTLMREKLFFDVSRDAGVPAPRTSFANVSINGTPWGFYTVVEQIDNQYLENSFLDITGNLFKSGDNVLPEQGPADLVFYGNPQLAYENRYELKSNETENDWSDLIEFIDFINNSTESEFEVGIQSKMEFSQYLRSLALDNLFSNLASYVGTAENYYLYNNPAGNKWHWIKWDGNEAFGLFDNGISDVVNLPLNYVNPENRPLIDNIFSNPNLYNQYLGQVCYLRDYYFNFSDMNSRINEMKLLIQSDVYADSNKQFSNSDFDFNIDNDLVVSSEVTIYGLKSFVANKQTYLDGIIDCNNCSYDIAGPSGCTYPNSSNYDPSAMIDDGSCLFCLGDFTGDGFVSTPDLTSFLSAFGNFCE